MEAFGIIGMSLGIMGMGLAATAYQKLEKLVNELKESGALESHNRTFMLSGFYAISMTRWRQGAP